MKLRKIVPMLFFLVTPALADEVHEEVAAYANAKGLTVEQFAKVIGSTPSKVEAFVSASERTGSNSLSALNSLVGMHIAMQDPNKRVVMLCMGIQVFDTPERPTPSQCSAAKSRLGLQ